MEQFTFTKGDAVKVCHCHEGVKAALIADGWKLDGDTKAPSKRDLLKARAGELELEYAANISNANLEKLIEEATE